MGSPVIDHVVLLVRDHIASRRFYEAALAPLGFGVLYESEDGAAFGVGDVDDFAIYRNDLPSRAAHVAFVANGWTAVEAFYEAALANGGRDHGSPRIWEEYHPGSYAAFVLDLDDNNIEAVFHDRSAGDASGYAGPGAVGEGTGPPGVRSSGSGNERAYDARRAANPVDAGHGWPRGATPKISMAASAKV